MDDASVGWIAAILIGGFVGLLSDRYRISDLSTFMNVAVGVAGAIIASAILHWFAATWAGWIGYLVGGFAGACILIAAVRVIRRA